MKELMGFTYEDNSHDVLAEQNIKALEHLISSKGKTVKPKNISGLTGKPAIEVYRELAKNHFKDQPFRDKDIRDLATEKGLLVNKSAINPPLCYRSARNISCQCPWNSNFNKMSCC